MPIGNTSEHRDSARLCFSGFGHNMNTKAKRD
jgi:hypothetical protein